MSSIDFYYMPLSPPCRTVLTVARQLGIDTHFNMKLVDVLKKEQMTPEFLSINYEHRIPTIVDGDLTLWESRAIITYLVNKFDRNGSLYPGDARTRAKINRWLYFDLGTLYEKFTQYVFPVILENEKPQPKNLEKLLQALETLETELIEDSFAISSEITLADHCLSVSISTIKASGIDISKFKKVDKYLIKCEEEIVDYEELNGEALKTFGAFVKSKFDQFQ